MVNGDGESVISEALRYMGVGKDADYELKNKTEDIMARVEKSLMPRRTFQIFKIETLKDRIYIPGAELFLEGRTAIKMLKDCHEAALFACTLGTAMDMMIRKAQVKDISEAVIIDACGNALIEALCDRTEEEIGKQCPGKYMTDRFSPGYGDLHIKYQSDICRILNTRKLIGISSNDGHLVTPCKSVTAIIGISDYPQPARIRGCRYCSMKKNCKIRGEHCE